MDINIQPIITLTSTAFQVISVENEPSLLEALNDLSCQLAILQTKLATRYSSDDLNTEDIVVHFDPGYDSAGDLGMSEDEEAEENELPYNEEEVVFDITYSNEGHFNIIIDYPMLGYKHTNYCMCNDGE